MKRQSRSLLALRLWFGKRHRNGLRDPELLLVQAQEEMAAMHAKNRERAVQAITQKNNLQYAIQELEKRAQKLEREAAEAEEQGRSLLVAQIRSELREAESRLGEQRQKLVMAEERAKAIRIAIRREEMRIREKTAEALALKAQLKNNQIQIAMNKALEGIQGIDNVDGVYERAVEKIRSAIAGREARAEVGAGEAHQDFDGRETAKYIFALEDERAEREAKYRLILFALLVVILVLIVLSIAR